jgi:hypothetical protein
MQEKQADTKVSGSGTFDLMAEIGPDKKLTVPHPSRNAAVFAAGKLGAR